MKGKIFNAQEIQTMLLISFFSGGLISIYPLANPEEKWEANPWVWKVQFEVINN